jgi:hypothetical protein
VEYQVKIDKRPDYAEIFKHLRNEGGYVDTFTGRLSRNKGAITYGNANDDIDSLNNFLSLINGQRVGLPVLIGVHEEEVVWKVYRSVRVKSYTYTSCWSETDYLCNLEPAWQRFRLLWKEKDAKDVLTTALYWYIQINTISSGLEGSIILAQTALELMYNWIIVETKKMITGGDALNITAANKMRLLLSIMNIGAGLPDNCEELKKLEQTDAPEAFAYIRNALVHGNEEKRKKLQNISTEAHFQALNLAVWYLEMCLLYVLEYNDSYWNRITHEKLPLPWRK